MDLFDKFKRRKKPPENIQKKMEQKQHDLSVGMSIENGVLKHVYKNGIANGVFVVPKEVSKIEMFAFSGLDNLRKVIMHDNIESIRQSAFHDCVNLTEVEGLESAHKLNSISGFAGCRNLKSITLPHTIENIGIEAFFECTSLSDINIPYGCWGISNKAFAGCTGLNQIQIPATMELIDSESFAGCKNATVIFLEDDKQLLADIITEQKNFEAEFNNEFTDTQQYTEPETEDFEIPKPTIEEQAQYFDDMNIRYRIINMMGEKYMWPSRPIDIISGAFSAVKEVISMDESKIEKVIKSGYKGKVSMAHPETNQLVSVDLAQIEQINKAQKNKKREQYYSQFLIPGGATVNWLINCEKNHYHNLGYSGNTIWETPIFFDAKIAVVDVTQPTADIYQYMRENEEFFTCVTFTKKEMDASSVYVPYEYDRTFSFYYPFGTRFDTDMLTQIGTALSILIDTARDLPINTLNKERLDLIEQKQKQIIELFFNGTNDKKAVERIMSDKDLYLTSPAKTPKPATETKDQLPYFTNSLIDDFNELQEYLKSQKTDTASENEKD